MTKHAPKRMPLPPILSGEWGYSSRWKKFDETKQGKMLPRQWLINLTEGIPISIWYDWHDDGPAPNEPEHHFGTVRFEYHQGREPVYDPKPSYLAARTLTAALRGFHFARRLDAGGADNYALRFEGGARWRIVAWTRAKEPHAVTLAPADAPAGRYAVTGHTGEALTAVEADAQGLKLTLTDAPQYLAQD